ncbi:MAG: oligosaccharide flippase family protein, partial [Ruminococcus sp.]|nr:oligosaccharide flippase family protein [Ruminococcus sp.]
GIITVIVTLNLFYGVFLQGLVKFEHEAKIYASSMQGLTLALCSFWTVIYFIFHDFFNQLFELNTVQMSFMLIMIWTSAVFQFWSAEQRVNNKYRLLVGLTILVMIAQPAIGVVLVQLSDAAYKATARILGMVIVNIAAYSWCFFVQMKRGKTFFSKKYWLYALKFNLPLVPHYLSQTLLYGSDRIMISRYVSESAAGIYSLAYSVAVIMTMFNTAITQTMGPWMYRKIKERKPQDIAPIVYSAMLIIAAANLTLIMLAPEAISIFAPPEYSDAKWVIPPVALSVFFMFMYDMFASFQFYFEKSWFIMAASVFGAALNIGLNYLFLSPRWFNFGYVAAGYTTLICYILYALCHYLCMRWVCKKHMDGAKVYDAKVLLGVSLCLVASGLMLSMTYEVPILRYSLVGIILLLLIIFHKKVINYAKKLMSLRKGD